MEYLTLNPDTLQADIRSVLVEMIMLAGRNDKRLLELRGGVSRTRIVEVAQFDVDISYVGQRDHIVTVSFRDSTAVCASRPSDNDDLSAAIDALLLSSASTSGSCTFSFVLGADDAWRAVTTSKSIGPSDGDEDPDDEEAPPKKAGPYKAKRPAGAVATYPQKMPVKRRPLPLDDDEDNEDK